MLRILFIDSTPTNQTFVEHCFEASGHVVQCLSSRDAAETLNRGHETIDLLLIDGSQSTTQAAELLQSVQKQKNSIATIVILGSGSPDILKQMLNLGAAECIVMPFTQEILFERIDSVLDGGMLYDAAAA